MKFRDLSKWTVNESVHGLIFFAQRLEELLFDYTLDSYKPSALNPPFLCIEALRVIEDIEEEALDPSNLTHVLDELVWAIREDKVSKTLLDVDLDQYVLRSEETPLAQKKIRLEVLSRTLEPRRYLEQCCKLLKEATIKNGKSDINTLARILVTTLVNMGLSKAFLYQKSKEYFFLGDSPKISSPNDLDPFVSSIMPVTHDFDVFFIVSDDVKQVAESIKPFRIEMVDKLPDNLIPFAESRGFAPSPDEVLIKIDHIRAYDCYTARERAERQIDTLKDLFTLFFHKNALRWQESTLISQCCIDAPAIVRTPKSSMDKAFDMRPAWASKQLNWLISNLALRFGGSFDKFNRIVDLHGTCVSNLIPENQLLNLWISLETIVPSHVGMNKINNITLSLDPFVRMTYIRRLVERAVVDLMFWNKRATKKILKKVTDSKGLKLPMKLIFLLGLPENESLRTELYAELKEFHLLRFRLFRLSEMFKSTQSVREMLDLHSKKVSWQLRRIYRTRNLIVHAGRTPTYLGTLIENGHDYLDMVLNEIMQHSCGTYRVVTLEQAFELQRLLLQKFNSALSGDEAFTKDRLLSLYNQE
jgi:hypothetical protein